MGGQVWMKAVAGDSAARFVLHGKKVAMPMLRGVSLPLTGSPAFSCLSASGGAAWMRDRQRQFSV